MLHKITQIHNNVYETDNIPWNILEYFSHWVNLCVLGTCNLSTWHNDHPSCYFQAFKTFDLSFGWQSVLQADHTYFNSNLLHPLKAFWILTDHSINSSSWSSSGLCQWSISWNLCALSKLWYTGQLVLKLVHSSITTHAI